jgi:hypothetical protein
MGMVLSLKTTWFDRQTSKKIINSSLYFVELKCKFFCIILKKDLYKNIKPKIKKNNEVMLAAKLPKYKDKKPIPISGTM